MSKDIYGWDTSQDSPILANQYSSDENNPENGEEDSNKSFYKRMMDYYKNNNWLQGLTSAAGGIAGAAIGGGYNEGAGGVFAAMQPLAKFLPGPWGAVASIGLGAAQRVFGYKLNKENINKVENNIANLKAFTSNAGSWDSFMQDVKSAPAAMKFSLGYIGSNGLANNGATDKFNDLTNKVAEGSSWVNRSLAASANRLDKQYTNMLEKNYTAAYGGPLNMATTRPLSPFGNRFNYGGMSALATHGADWNNGLKFINVGGSHEENPYEGVQMGVDQEGTPNLVEEGEVIWNDYVFSNRMIVPKRVKEKLGIKGMNDITYAEAAKKIQKEAEERPNDPISKRGLDATLGRLAYAQEEDRQKKQEKEQQQAIMAAYGGELATDETNEDNEYSDGGKIHIKESKKGTFTKAATEHGMGVQEFASKVLANKDNYSPAMVKKANFAKNASKWHAYGGELGNLFPGDGPYPNILNPDIYDPLILGNLEPGNGPVEVSSELPWYFGASVLGGYNKETPQEIFIRHQNKFIKDKGLPFFPTPTDRIKLQFKNPIQHDVYGDNGWTPTPQSKSTLEAKPKFAYADNLTVKNPEEPQKKKGFDLSYLRYAPVIGSAINVFTDLAGLTNKPDYSNADSLMAATQNLRDVRPPSIGDYVRYTPFDRMFYLNQLNANAGATRRGLMDIAGGNRGAAMAGLLASDYNTLGKIGELARQAEEYNLANRFKTAEFNRGTNQFNSEMDLKAQMANNQNASIKLDVLAKAAAIRDAIDARVGAARSANLTNFFDNLGNIGWEAANRNMTEGITRYGYNGIYNPIYMGTSWNSGITPEEYNEIIERRRKADEEWKAAKSKKGTSKAYGGLLTYKRRK